MYQKAMIFLSIVGVSLSLILGLLTVITWQIVAVLVTVSIGIPSLVLAYEKLKLEVGVKPKKKKDSVTARAQTRLSREIKTQKSLLLPDSTKITKLNIDNSFLDQIHEQAHHQAVGRYHDAQFAYFAIQVLPFSEIGARVNIYLDFYSKWADKICKFVNRDSSQQVEHLSPDKRAMSDYERAIFTTIPWRESPQWMEFIDRVYAKIGPLPSVKGTHYHLSAHPAAGWHLTFDDGFSGNEYAFSWNGKGLDEHSIRKRD